MVIEEAKKRVDIAALGIDSVRFRRAVTGAVIMEVAGADNGDRADALAARLRDVLSAESVRVSRPFKATEILVSGLDDSVTSEDVAAAIARLGDCHREAVKVGTIRNSSYGMGSVWASCPVTAAKKVAEGKLLVGWTAARVKVLQPRELRCFRCLNTGHVRGQCTAAVDRSQQCYKCGDTGHRASECRANARCPLCADDNKKSDHRLGSKKCSAPKPKMNRRRPAGPAVSTQDSATCPPDGTVETLMDIQSICP